ncbi:disease resistance protein RPM1-like [Pistacia vera]|uniref:disease resistance protein RPM1-like n=1 Tax=Pistacia vera TaxID=55513 RepID=UPI001262E9D5|nr:disease resistance protein RPM1-like [Pistacia vera]
MAAEIPIFLLKEKLRSLAKGSQIIQPIEGAQLHRSIKKLSEVEELLKSDSSNGSSNSELLQAVYLAEDAIDSFTAIQKKKITAYVHLNLPYSQSCFLKNLEKLVGKISNLSKTSTSNTEDRMEELPELILNGDRSHFHISVVEYGSEREPLWKIYNYESIKKLFDCRAWVRVAEEFEKMQLLIDIFKQVTGKSEAMENLQLDSLRQDLHNFLVEKRYLVVLIDVRTPDIWEILKFALPNSSNGSRVIFSFREADAERCPDITFFGREISLDPKPIMQVASANSKDDEADILMAEQKERLKGMIEYLKEETDIVGMRDTVLELAKLTLNGRDKYYLISVVDVEGSGRTTIVKTIYNSPYIRQNFECLAWFSVPAFDVYDTRNMLIDIMKQVTLESSVEGRPLDILELENKLNKVLSEKRFLIVLDDVHLPGAWNDLQTIIPSTSNGSRVILITSDAFVARCFSPSVVIFKLNRLREDEGWELFLNRARVSLGDESYPDLRNLREKIWQRCRGLPLAICVLGGLFSCKRNYTEWPKVIEQILPEDKKNEGVTKHTNQKETSMTDEYAAFDEGQSISTDPLASLGKQCPSYIWNLGYKDLSPHLKACLNYICLFPKSYRIPVRRLFHLWLAEGLETPREATEVSPEDQVKKEVPPQDQVKTEVPPQNQVMPEVPPEDQVKKDVPPGNQVKKEVLPEDLVRRDFDELEKRNMIEVTTRKLDGSPKTCRMPSTLYDTLFPMAEGMGFFYVHGKSDSASSSPKSCIHRLVEHSDIHYNPLPDECIRNLRSYISFNTRKGAKPVEEARSFLNKKIIKRGVGFLRVLDLERVYKPVLPEAIGKLKLLTYLGLRSTFLDSIPISIGDLPCLETLDVKHTNITTLPMSIWKIKTLRHLYMNDIHFEMLKKKRFSFSAMTNLHTWWGLFIGNAKDCLPMNWLKNLSSLRKLGLTFHKISLPGITDWISTLTNLRSLKLRSIDDYSEPSDLNLESMHKLVNLEELYLLGKLPRVIDINQLPHKLEILTLSMSQLFDDPMPILGQLTHLKVLRLFAHSYIGEDMTCTDGFPQLRVLKLWVLPSLCGWTIEKGAMPVLKELEIRYCRNLKKLEGLNNVTSLRELILTNMKEKFSAEVKKSLHKYAVTTENNWKVEPPWAAATHILRCIKEM